MSQSGGGVIIAGAFLLLWVGGIAGPAEADPKPAGEAAAAGTLEQLLREVAAMRAEITTLKSEVQELRSARAAGADLAEAAVSEAGTRKKPDSLTPAPEPSTAFAEKRLTAGFGGQYSKPFLSRLGRNTYLGGYIDLEFKDEENRDKFFDQHRLVPFIYGDISELFKFASEIEIEHGGPNSPDGGDLKVEFATIDMTFSEAVNFRSGIILSPLGKVNLVHDSPLQDLTDRPLVDRLIIPTTLSEVGAGFFGSIYPGEEDRLDYEIYVVDGFDGLRKNGTTTISRANGLRSARGGETVINNHLSTVGRVAYSPFLGLELGVSSHNGRYDEDHDNWLSISAFDFAWQSGAFEVLGEVAYAHIGRDNFARASGVPDDFWGYYLQTNYHFMPGFLTDWVPSVFTEDSTFTLVGRWEYDDLDGRKLTRGTVGLNFRYTEDTVIKFDYQFNTGYGDNTIDRDDNDAFLFSVASYF